MKHIDVLIIGAGAAGLMCGIEAGARGRRVLILDKTNKPGKKILMSGGGRCNFTNTQTTPAQFLSNNPHFCKSALSRYTPFHFIDMVNRHNINYVEKAPGQLFCEEKSSDIVHMLLTECQQYNVDILLSQTIQSVKKEDHRFIVQCNSVSYTCESLVIATGGLSIPTLGGSPFGYQIAKQFGLSVYPTRAGLVPLTLHVKDKERFESLAGISVESTVHCRQQHFQENILFTHRGLSGPAILQISSYWTPGDELEITLLPQINLYELLVSARKNSPDLHLKTTLSGLIAKRLLNALYEADALEKPLKHYSNQALQTITKTLQALTIKPNATEGYRTAEVTLGGVDTNELSSQRMESKKIAGLFFIGEVVDVTGWLGGYNFQWAWSSGWAAGQVV